MPSCRSRARCGRRYGRSAARNHGEISPSFARYTGAGIMAKRDAARGTRQREQRRRGNRGAEQGNHEDAGAGGARGARPVVHASDVDRLGRGQRDRSADPAAAAASCPCRRRSPAAQRCASARSAARTASGPRRARSAPWRCSSPRTGAWCSREARAPRRLRPSLESTAELLDGLDEPDPFRHRRPWPGPDRGDADVAERSVAPVADEHAVTHGHLGLAAVALLA